MNAHDPAAGAGLSDAEREALLRAWPWPKEAATTEHGFADVVTAVERILDAERERIAQAIEALPRKCDNVTLAARIARGGDPRPSGGCLHGPGARLGVCPSCGTVVEEAELARVRGEGS